jgi:glutamate/tyrosine decarboxylase-like PLP-dependent enzyme
MRCSPRCSLYKNNHVSPYTYFTSKDLHLGEISLECSRAGASAAALWATLRCLPLTAAGLGRALLASRTAAMTALDRARTTSTLTPVIEPALDIFTVAPLGRGSRERASDVSARTQAAFDALAADDSDPLYLAVWRLPRSLGRMALPDVVWDREECAVLRSVLMKPEHRERAASIVDRMAAAAV